jgi:hypothetical protein
MDYFYMQLVALKGEEVTDIFYKGAVSSISCEKMICLMASLS